MTTFNPNVSELVARNRRFAEGFTGAAMPAAPSLGLAVVACMDARMDISALLDLEVGEAHVIRNAGGVITDDVVRSLCLSQRALGTREILLIHHTECGLQSVSEGSFRDELEAATGIKPTWALEAFSDPYDDVRQSIRRIRSSPFIPYDEHVSGFVYDVATGRLDDVAPPG